jgi:undecaprenyl-diphosphatase
MTAAVGVQLQSPQPSKLEWLTPARCRLILVAMLLLGAAANVIYLNWNCPIDLSGDEAQYWDWSRRLDLCYYSKGPLVAFLIRASCAVFGETMPAVRYPGILLGAGTSLFAYLLTLTLFRSDRLALGAVVLSSLVPIFIFGGVFMTIDAPLFFCWAAATYFAAVAIFDQKFWAWIVVGVFVGFGILAKYAMFLWIPSVFLFCAADLLNRKRNLRGALSATMIALLFTIPVIVWNQRHGWVSLKHVAHQTGTSGGSFLRGNFFELIGSQIAALNPIIAAIVVFAIIYALRARQSAEPHARQLRLLLCIGLPFFVLTAISSLLAKAQMNWPAPAYFSLLILGAYFLSTRMRSPQLWKAWKGWVFAAGVIGIVIYPIARDPSLLFPPVRAINHLAQKNKPINPAPMMAKIAGWKQLGENVGQTLSTMQPGSFILCDDYMQTAETAFYTPGQPTTYCAGSYYVSDPKRLTQYDMWKDRWLTPTIDGQPNPLLGGDAIYVGKGGEIPPEIPAAFERVEKLPVLPVTVRGFEVRTFKLWRCYTFKGMSRPSGHETF